jgi:nucleotide-binding universal stress UspA family protein
MEKIVVGIDGSDASKAALRWAVDDARGRGAEVVALHAYDVELPTTDAVPTAPIDIPAFVAEIHEEAQRFAVDLVDDVVGKAATVDVAPIAVEETDAARALIDASRDADLLVVGSHGRGISGLRLGSVSLECAQHAECPVVIHRGERPTSSSD